MALTHHRPALVASDDIRDEEPVVPAVVEVEQPTPLSMVVIAGVALIAGLWWGKVVLIPIVLSILISYALEPIVARLHTWHVPRVVGVPIVLTIVLTSGVAGAYGLRGEASAFIERLPSAVHVVATSIQHATRGTPSAVSRVQQAADELEKAASAATARSGTASRRCGLTNRRSGGPAGCGRDGRAPSSSRRSHSSSSASPTTC